MLNPLLLQPKMYNWIIFIFSLVLLVEVSISGACQPAFPHDLLAKFTSLRSHTLFWAEDSASLRGTLSHNLASKFQQSLTQSIK
ncbi:MAG: hypothetical protein EHM12_10365 [Dehalococcoidia bacterium]|nr:MAG: hypothetical protein EHM12_10365 [Dehalococcoidia bacterium]